jgi:ABC-type phosphate/phosphonate transport system ATPase subunit
MPVPRRLADLVVEAMRDSRVVALLGPRQAGKSTLAQMLAAERLFLIRIRRPWHVNLGQRHVTTRSYSPANSLTTRIQLNGPQRPDRALRATSGRRSPG